jgi:hypothetical protein
MPTKHGAYAVTKALKQGRHLDRRFRIGRQLATVRENLIAECSEGKLSQAQNILLDRIIEKLAFLNCMASYCMDQEQLVSPKGELIGVLRHSYLAFSEALRRDLVGLSQLGLKIKEADLYERWRESFLKGVNGEGDHPST